MLQFSVILFQDWIGPNIPSSELTCTLCQASCQLICQIYAPLENSIYHRSLYIFACIQPSCWNHSQSWKVFRGQRKDTTEAKAEPGTGAQSAFDDVDWSDDEETECNLSEQLQDLQLRPASTSQDDNGNIAMASTPSPDGAEAMIHDEVSANVEADQIQEVCLV